ncbi:PREDICTED: putative F-box protein At3g23970 [Ipomoea nil]|uniref:putative F-box protein At3g23970 n=1 Tax=Ipomoea nil TaxID=35883 RepID=UPI0009015943|nr:PREDICTED: putative F-box protein At3g23970 [Ipomoea nil]
MAEILSKLPSKCLARVRFVSKEWMSMVSDRTFVKQQLKPGEKLSGFFFQEYGCDSRELWGDFNALINYINIDFDFTEVTDVKKGVLNFLPKDVIITSSSHGLVCCRSSSMCSKQILYVCNPLTREVITVPSTSNISRPQQLESDTVLVFDPFESHTDVSTNFQLVTICETQIYRRFPDREVVFSFHIYSSQTKDWKTSTAICRYSHFLLNMGFVIILGVIFWPTKGQGILRFNPKNEECFIIEKPFLQPFFFGSDGTCMGESEGKLQFLRITKEKLQVWELIDLFSSDWSLEYSMSLEDIEKANPCLGTKLTRKSFPWISPLSLKNRTLLLKVWGEMFSFHLDSRKAKRLCPYSAYGQDIFEYKVIPYTMCLVPLT